MSEPTIREYKDGKKILFGFNEGETEYIHDGNDIISKVVLSWDLNKIVGSMMIMSLIINNKQFIYKCEYSESLFSRHINLNVYNGGDNNTRMIENIGDYLNRLLTETKDYIKDDCHHDREITQQYSNNLKALFLIFLFIDMRIRRFVFTNNNILIKTMKTKPSHVDRGHRFIDSYKCKIIEFFNGMSTFNDIINHARREWMFIYK